MKFTLYLLLVVLLFCCNGSNKKQVINGHTYDQTMLDLEQFNNDSMVYMSTPTYYRYLDDSIIRTVIVRLPTDPHSEMVNPLAPISIGA